jgi:hypothetical protein
MYKNCGAPLALHSLHARAIHADVINIHVFPIEKESQNRALYRRIVGTL